MQSPTPLVDRPRGFGIPSVLIDGNDILASYTASVVATDHARSGQGPAFIEADTYRIGAHTSSDDPSRYTAATTSCPRGSSATRSPARPRTCAARVSPTSSSPRSTRRARTSPPTSGVRTVALTPPSVDVMFDNVYREPHPLIAEQKAWLERYEAGYEGGAHA